jgi:hypothetical protein
MAQLAGAGHEGGELLRGGGELRIGCHRRAAFLVAEGIRAVENALHDVCQIGRLISHVQGHALRRFLQAARTVACEPVGGQAVGVSRPQVLTGLTRKIAIL